MELRPGAFGEAAASQVRSQTSLNEVSTGDGNEVLRPPLKWAGGKRWQVRHLREVWEANAHRRLVEPFCGGLAVSLGLKPNRALLNDVNPHVVNFYEWLKKGLTVNLVMKKSKKQFYKHRTQFNRLLLDGKQDSAEAALLFYYLNRTGYNGLCRFNRQGGFNVPYGRYKRINYAESRDFIVYQDAFKDWEFSHVDFEQLRLDAHDFVYADPPYDVEFTQYAKHGFSWDDQERVAKWLAKHKGPVVLSNQATTRIINLYHDLGFKVDYLKAPRLISCNGDRTPAREVLATKNV